MPNQEIKENSSNSSKQEGDCNTKTPSCDNKKPKQISPSKHWFFTFNNYTEEDINNIVPKFQEKCSKYVFQEEIGEEGTPHLQGYCEFHGKIRPFSLGLTTKISWRKPARISAVIEYCQKEHTSNGRIWYKDIIVKKALKTISRLYPWQEELLNELIKEPDDRKIYYYYGAEGNKGKSAFAKYLCIKHKAIILSGKRDDMKQGVNSFIEKGGIPNIIIIDVPRCSQSYISWAGIEEVKNGCFYSPKYEGGMCLYDPPHVVVFANCEPDLSALSQDRWIIKEL